MNKPASRQVYLENNGLFPLLFQNGSVQALTDGYNVDEDVNVFIAHFAIHFKFTMRTNSFRRFRFSQDSVVLHLSDHILNRDTRGWSIAVEIQMHVQFCTFIDNKETFDYCEDASI